MASESDQLLQMFQEFDVLMRWDAWDAIDGAFKRGAESDAIVSDLYKVGMLRFMSSVRDKLPHWWSFYHRVYKDLEKEGKDAKQILRGLEPKEDKVIVPFNVSFQDEMAN